MAAAMCTQSHAEEAETIMSCQMLGVNSICGGVGAIGIDGEPMQETNMQGDDPDAQLERRIEREYLTVWLGKTREERKAASAELARLVPLRSRRRVEQMEKERGLR